MQWKLKINNKKILKDVTEKDFKKSKNLIASRRETPQQVPYFKCT